MKKTLWFIMIILVFASVRTWAAFETLGPSVTSAAMGGISIVSKNNISSLIGNPAGLANFNESEIYFAKTELLSIDISQSLGAYFSLFGSAGWAIGLNEVRDLSGGYQENQLIWGVGKKLGSLKIGSTVRIKSLKSDYKARGGAIDLGLIYDIGLVSFGLTGRNLIDRVVYETGYVLKQKAVWICSIFHQMNPYWQGGFELDSNKEIHFGVERWLNDNIAVRLGFDGNQKGTAGFGIRKNKWQLDYSFQTHSIGATHQISSSYKF